MYLFSDDDKKALAQLLNLAEEHVPLSFNTHRCDVLDAIATLIRARLVSYDTGSKKWKAAR